MPPTATQAARPWPIQIHRGRQSRYPPPPGLPQSSRDPAIPEAFWNRCLATGSELVPGSMIRLRWHRIRFPLPPPEPSVCELPPQDPALPPKKTLPAHSPAQILPKHAKRRNQQQPCDSHKFKTPNISSEVRDGCNMMTNRSKCNLKPVSTSTTSAATCRRTIANWSSMRIPTSRT